MSPNHHDALFKAVFAQPEHARGELNAVLPEALTTALDWVTLVHVPGSFVDPELAEQHTDLLFSIDVRGTAEQTLVYLLFEHQSKSDPHMAFRLLRYVLRIWERWRDQHGESTRLPVIVPVVLYHGARRWSAARSIEDLITVPSELTAVVRPYIPAFSYLVDDLSQLPDEALRARAMTALARLVVMCFKHLRTAQDPVRLLDQWVSLFNEVWRARGGLESLELVLRYIFVVSEKVDLTAVRSILERAVGPETGDKAMATIGEQLIEQGVQKGLVAGKREMLLAQLRQRFGDSVDGEVERRISTAETEQLDRWASRVLFATTLADVLG